MRESLVLDISYHIDPSLPNISSLSPDCFFYNLQPQYCTWEIWTLIEVMYKWRTTAKNDVLITCTCVQHYVSPSKFNFQKHVIHYRVSSWYRINLSQSNKVVSYDHLTFLKEILSSFVLHIYKRGLKKRYVCFNIN